jgi:hypothetical protein
MNISIIIPIHEFNDVVSNYLDKAFESIIKQEKLSEIINVALVYPKDISELINSYAGKYLVEEIKTKINILFIENEGKTDYQSQVNLAVKSVNTDYFTVLEFDDEISATFLYNAEKYVISYTDIDIFLSMMIEVNEKNEGIKLTNETVWAQQFVGENGEMGYLNVNALKQYTDFKLSGAVIKKSEFNNIGGYKSNIKLSFMYEFLLRALNNACKIYSIPKIGYKHLATRENSLFDLYLKNMLLNERKFWFDVANKESNFINDRNIDTSSLDKIIVSEK